MDNITCTCCVGLQIQHKVNYVMLSALTKKCSIANSNTKCCDYTIMGVANGALGPIAVARKLSIK